MNLLFFLHALSQPSRLSSPQFVRRGFLQNMTGLLLAPVARPIRERARASARARARNFDSCHFQLRAL